MGTRGRGRPSAARRRPTAGDPPAEPGPGRAAVCTTDPDATLVKDRQARRGEPADKQHTAVDGRAGVVPDVSRSPRGGGGARDDHGRGAARRRPDRHGPPGPARDDGRGRRQHPGVRRAGGGRARSRRWRRPRPSRAAAARRRPGPPVQAGRQEPDRTPPARANASCARTASPTARDSKPTAPRRPTAAPVRRARGLHRQQGAAPGHPAAQGPSRPAARPTRAREMGGARAPHRRPPATASAPKASTARPRPGTGSPAPSGAAEPTCGSRPT
jgi:hypothetical protein